MIDTDTEPPTDLRSIFSEPVTDIRLEIGCGAGEHLLHEAEQAPDCGFIGVEPFQEGLAKTVSAIEDRGHLNIRVYQHDAAILLDWLPQISLARIDLLYPDPWPKRRHWKRRFISVANLERMAMALQPGGSLRVATDIAAYADWTLLAVLRSRDFAWTATNADDWRRPWRGWPGTRYEAKALRAGRTPIYLAFRRG